MSAAPRTTWTPSLRARGIFVAFICLSTAACGPTRAAELATLDRVSPHEVEVGEQISLEGSGFIVGPATLVLQGTLSSPGRETRRDEARLELPVLATSTTRASARLGRRHLDQLGSPHTTFSGRAILRFDSEAGPDAPPVVATLDNIRLELFSGALNRSGSARTSREAGEALLEQLGITGVVLPEGRGVLIERLLSSAPGARAGLQPGEVIVTAGDVTVATVSDLAPPPRSSRVVLGVRTPGGRVRRVACPLSTPTLAPDADRIAAFAIAGAALLFILAAAGPLRGPLRWLGEQLARDAGGPRELLAALADIGRRSPVGAVFALAAFAAAPFLVMASAPFGIVPIAGGTVLVGVAASAAPRKGWRRLASVLAIPRAAPLLALVAIGALHGASTSLVDVVDAQGAAPWRWLVAADPGALILLLIAASITCASGPTRAGSATMLHHGLVGSVIAASALGGWNAPGDQLLAGQLLFAAKAWIVGLCVAFGGRGKATVAILFAAPAAALSIAAAVLPMPAWAASASSWAALTIAVFVALPVVAGRVLRRPAPISREVTDDPPRVTTAPALPPTLHAEPGRG